MLLPIKSVVLAYILKKWVRGTINGLTTKVYIPYHFVSFQISKIYIFSIIYSKEVEIIFILCLKQRKIKNWWVRHKKQPSKYDNLSFINIYLQFLNLCRTVHFILIESMNNSRNVYSSEVPVYTLRT